MGDAHYRPKRTSTHEWVHERHHEWPHEWTHECAHEIADESVHDRTHELISVFSALQFKDSHESSHETSRGGVHGSAHESVLFSLVLFVGQRCRRNNFFAHSLKTLLPPQIASLGRFSWAMSAFGVFPLFLPWAIRACGDPQSYSSLAIIAFGAFDCPQILLSLRKMVHRVHQVSRFFCDCDFLMQVKKSQRFVLPREKPCVSSLRWLCDFSREKKRPPCSLAGDGDVYDRKSRRLALAIVLFLGLSENGHEDCDPPFPLQTPKPQKIQRDRKVAQKLLLGPRPKATQKWLKSGFWTVFVLLSNFWVIFGREPKSNFWVTFLCLWIFRGLGVCRGSGGPQHEESKTP